MEKERERNINRLPLLCIPTGDRIHNPLLCRMMPNQLSHTNQRFKKKNNKIQGLLFSYLPLKFPLETTAGVGGRLNVARGGQGRGE